MFALSPPSDPDDPPRDLKVTPTSNGFRIAWDAPAVLSGPTSYLVQVTWLSCFFYRHTHKSVLCWSDFLTYGGVISYCLHFTTTLLIHIQVLNLNDLSCHTRWTVLVWTSRKSELQESWRLSLWLAWLLSLVTWWLSRPSLVHWSMLPAKGKPSGLLNF